LELARSVLTVRPCQKIVGDAGILLPPDDLERWVHALESVVSETEKRISLKEEALKRSTSFQWEQSIMQTLSLYEKSNKVISSSSPSVDDQDSTDGQEYLGTPKKGAVYLPTM